jgi:hypothetical protein
LVVVVAVVVVVVDTVAVEVVQLLHSTGQSFRVAAPNSSCEHCVISIESHIVGSGDPLQESVVVVTVVAVNVVVVVVKVAVVVVVVREVVVVVSTQLPQRTKHLALTTMPMSPAAAQYF